MKTLYNEANCLQSNCWARDIASLGLSGPSKSFMVAITLFVSVSRIALDILDVPNLPYNSTKDKMRCKHGYCGEGFDRYCCKPSDATIPVGTIIAVVGAFLIIILLVCLICLYRKRPELFNKCLKSYQGATPPQTAVTRTVHTTVTTHVHHHQPQSMVYFPTTTSATYSSVCTTGNEYPCGKDPQQVPLQEVKIAPKSSVPSAPPPSYEETQRMLT